MGRYGRTKKIRLEISRSLIRDVFGEDNRFSRLLEYSPQASRKSSGNSA
jgi:hypothetical protein